MKTLLLGCALALCFPAAAQVSALPTDSVTHKIAYQGVVQMPGASQPELYSRARALALHSSAPQQLDDPTKTVLSIWEKQLFSGSGSGRLLRYTLAISAKEGRYRYTLTDFENKTLPVGFVNAANGIALTAPGGTAPLERVLANPDGYRRGKPTAALLGYEAAVQAAVTQAVADVQNGMKGNAASGW